MLTIPSMRTCAIYIWCVICIILRFSTIVGLSKDDFLSGNFIEYDTEDAVVIEALPSEEYPRLLVQNNTFPHRIKREISWQSLLSSPCITSQGKLGKCTSFRECYPYFKLPNLHNWESWVLGIYDTCSYFADNGQQAFGVCCTNLEKPTSPPQTTTEFMSTKPSTSTETIEMTTFNPFPSWPPPIPPLPTHPPNHTIPPLPTHPPTTYPTLPTFPPPSTKPTQKPTPPTWPPFPTFPSTTKPPQKPTFPPRPIKPTKPARPTRPTRPTFPPKPTKPTFPTRPTFPSKPTKPTFPTTPTFPPKPTKPTFPTTPTFPPKPTKPTFPTRPSRPPQPIKPTFPPRPIKPPTTLPPENEIEAVCGAKNGYQDQERIVGGQNADINEWPWVAVLFNSGRQFCGGSLIDHEHILSAAHCVAHMTSWDVARLTIRLGDHNIRISTETKHVEKRVKRVVRHRGFDPRTLYNDVAVLTLDSPVPFSKTIRPICLPQGNQDYAGLSATVIGWGSLRESGVQPAELQEVSVPIWENRDCKLKYGIAAPGGIVDHFLCAGQPSRDSCSGDSGGPLMIYQGKWTQVGIVSWGIGCGKGQYPGVYTRVTSFMSWIMKNLE